ncbi:MAG: complex I subunit 1 family protein [archaeon]
MQIMLFDVLVYPGLLFMVSASLIYSGIIRKVAARMQHRVGPPIIQPFYDTIKLFAKENITPDGAKAGFSFWPVVAIVSVILAGLMTPVAGGAPLGASGDIIVLIYFLALSSAAMYIAGFSSSNPFASMGAIRGITQMIAYELPFIIAILVPIIALSGKVNSLSASAINGFQAGNVWLIQLYPLAGVVFLLTLIAKVEMPPFHTPAAHQEIVGGYSAEFTGSRLAMIELTHIVKTFVVLSLAVALFLGGAVTLPVFLLKTLGLVFILTLLRVIMARLRIDHILEFYWLFAIVASVDLIRVILVPAMV